MAGANARKRANKGKRFMRIEISLGFPSPDATVPHPFVSAAADAKGWEPTSAAIPIRVASGLGQESPSRAASLKKTTRAEASPGTRGDYRFRDRERQTSKGRERRNEPPLGLSPLHQPQPSLPQRQQNEHPFSSNGKLSNYHLSQPRGSPQLPPKPRARSLSLPSFLFPWSLSLRTWWRW
jgi:hypothetical protein